MTFDVAQIFAYSPMLILIGMACVILLAETFIQGKARSGLAWLGVAGCVAALVAIVAAWADAGTPTSHFDGMLTVDRMALYLDAAFVVAALLTLLFAPLPARAGVRVRRVLRAGAVRHRRNGDCRACHQPGVAAHRHRDDVAGRLRLSPAARLPQPAQRRGGHESTSSWAPSPPASWSTGIARSSTAPPGRWSCTYAGIAAKTAEAHKMPIFYLGEYFILIALVFKVAAVPFHMWAPDAPTKGRRLASHRLHGGRGEGGRLRRAHPTPRHRLLEPAHGLRLHRLPGLGAVGALAALNHDAGEPGGHPPGQHQADARLLVDRARHRLHAHRGGRRGPGCRRRQARRALPICSPTPSRRWACSASFGLDRQPQRRAPVHRRLGRGRRRASSGGPGDDALPAFAGRHPAGGRLLRQVPVSLPAPRPCRRPSSTGWSWWASSTAW